VCASGNEKDIISEVNELKKFLTKTQDCLNYSLTNLDQDKI